LTEAPEIQVNYGFSKLSFGSSPDQATSVFGEPNEVTEIEDEIFLKPKLLWHYHIPNMTLFFENVKKIYFSSAECKHQDTLLFGEKVMGADEKTLLELLKKHQYSLSERESLPWGEICLHFEEAGLECYFENKRLVALTFSQKAIEQQA